MFKYKYDEEFLEGGDGITRSRMGTVYKLEKPNTTHFYNSVSHKCRKLWNDLPVLLRSIDVRDTFNVLLKAHYRDLYFSVPGSFGSIGFADVCCFVVVFFVCFFRHDSFV